MVEHVGGVHTLSHLLREIEDLLKQPSVGFELARRGVNTSIALIAVQGIMAYVEGDERRAGDDLGTAADEIKIRRARR